LSTHEAVFASQPGDPSRPAPEPVSADRALKLQRRRELVAQRAKGPLPNRPSRRRFMSSTVGCVVKLQVKATCDRPVPARSPKYAAKRRLVDRVAHARRDDALGA
jgi:hypothetical protein